jgi:phosphoenolpyruvate carboxykinase (GTP)
MGSEATAAAVGQAAIRRDPMAMLPFCGYNMGDYWKHWLSMGKRVKKLPAIFRVNWFRKDANGKFMWPGYGENMRVLQWIVTRANAHGAAVKSPFGLMPKREDLNWNGIQYDAAKFYELMQVERAAAKAEADEQKDYFAKFGDRLPPEMEKQRQLLIERLGKAPEIWKLESAA